jgi:hypothetical protein
MGNIRQKLHLLVTQHSVPSDEVVLAGMAQVFTWDADFIFRLWWAEGTTDSHDVDPHHCPTTLNGRTFVLNMGDWWELSYRRGKRPLAFAVGAQHKLALSFLEFFPARLWVTDFKWKPSPKTPLVWLEDGKPVARYERLHGEVRHTNSGHPRQPVLSRWLVKRASWEKLVSEHGPFRMLDDFERFSSNAER